MHTFLLIIGAIAFVCALGAITMHLEKKRTNALSAFANSMGFTFSNQASPALLGPARSFHLFDQGHSHKIKNLIQGVANDIDVRIFDYRYTTGHGKNSHTYNQTVILFTSDRLQLPDFAMRPENMFHKIGSAFGRQDIDFDRNPTFSKNYLLRGSSEKNVRDTFTRDVLSYFEQHPNLCVEGEADTLGFYRASKKVAPEQVPTLLEEAFTVFGLFAQAPQPTRTGVKIRV